ncbi:hypothetical protein L204_104289 [Cryptococcus depauperatus]
MVGGLLIRHLGRQETTSIPSCVAECISTGNTTGCDGVNDYRCVCNSSAYIHSVATCMSQTCTAKEIAVGQIYTEQACSYYGIPLQNGTSTISLSPVETANTTMAPPVIYSHTFTSLQAVFTSICSALLLLALITGCMACRSRYKRERASGQSRAWTHVNASNRNSSPQCDSKLRLFSKHSRHDPTATFLSDDGSSGSSFGNTSPSQPPQIALDIIRDGYSRSGSEDSGHSGNTHFTNRLHSTESSSCEAWEMQVKHVEVRRESENLDLSCTNKRESIIEAKGSAVRSNILDKGIAV